MVRQAWELIRLGFEFFVLRREKPYVVGIISNDTCNLNCRQCRVANLYGYTMKHDEVRGHLERYYRKGARLVYFEGGEPYLWRDGDRRLSDLVDLAHQIGYLRAYVYTNGTQPIDAHADFTWISIDGLGDTLRRLRGVELESILANLRALKERFGIVFVVNTVNCLEVRTFLEFVSEALPRVRVMFYFHTPYYGLDELMLSPAQKAAAIAELLQCKREGLPVFNSKAGLKAILDGSWKRPMNCTYLVDQTGDYRCCRSIEHPQVCRDCGYAAGAEVALMQLLRPGPLLNAVRMF